MRTIVLRNDDERTPGNSSAGEERRVTLFFPVTGDEYKQTRAAVEGVAPGGEEGSGPAGTPVGGRYVVTTDQQRREWGLPDLANGPGGDAAAPGDPAAMERAGAVSVVDSPTRSTCSSRTARAGPAPRPWWTARAATSLRPRPEDAGAAGHAPGRS